MEVTTEYLLERVDRNATDTAAVTARVNTLNGQLGRQAEATEALEAAHARTREEMLAGFGNTREEMLAGFARVRTDVRELKTRASIFAAIGSAVATAIIGGLITFFVYSTLNHAQQKATPPAATAQAIAH